MLLKLFPRSSFFNFGNKPKAGGLMSGLYGGWGNTCHPFFSKISDTAPEAQDRALMYGRWPLRKIWLQSVSSSISRLRFAENGPPSLPIPTPCSLLKSGSQLSLKSERLHNPTDRASAVCRPVEMTYAYRYIPLPPRHPSVNLPTIEKRKHSACVLLYRILLACCDNKNNWFISLKCNSYTDKLSRWRRLSENYRVIQNDCRGFNNLSYTIHLRQEYIFIFI